MRNASLCTCIFSILYHNRFHLTEVLMCTPIHNSTSDTWHFQVTIYSLIFLLFQAEWIGQVNVEEKKLGTNDTKLIIKVANPLKKEVSEFV